MIEEMLDSFAAIAKGWREEAGRRRRVAATDPAADTLDYTAAELEKHIELTRASTARLTVEQFARLRDVSDQTVRNWIKWKWLPAEDGPRGYLIDPKAVVTRHAKAS